MPTPTLVFAAILSTLLGAAFHFIIGGSLRRLLFYIWASWVGFGVGHLVGMISGINALNVGTLHLLSALLGTIAALVAVWVLTRVRTSAK